MEKLRERQDLVSFISRNFDLKNFSRNCNYQGCRRLPTKEATIVEMDPCTKRKRDLVSLYFCAEHYNAVMEDLMEKVQNIRSNKIIDKRIFEIGYMTH